MIKSWRRVRSNIPQSFRVFSVRTDTAVSPRTGMEHDFYIIESRDWVNVIPITPDQRVVMIRQYRHGSREVTLEIPGGLTDAGDTSEEAASRELMEETGYLSEEWVKIGVGDPSLADGARQRRGDELLPDELGECLGTFPSGGDFV